jgi:predicted nucleic acid-binding protein
MTLIDTSSWIEALRRDGRPDVRDRVRKLLVEGQAVWCDLVSLELWNGAHGEYERGRLAALEKEIGSLATTEAVWALARTLAKKARKTGKTVPASDLVISACGFHYQVEIEHCDHHFDIISRIHLSPE